MIAKTEAIVLRIAPFSRTSHVVTWLTPEYGSLATAAKGACRPKSPLLGQYDLFYTCEIVFYARHRQGLHILHECTPLNTRAYLRTDWRAAACASYACDVTGRIVTAGNRHEQALYDVCRRLLDRLSRCPASLAILLWFELRLLDAAGVMPRLDRCALCGTRPLPDSPAAFSVSAGGIVCSRCMRPESTQTHVPAVLLKRMRAWQSGAAPDLEAGPETVSPSQLLALRRLLGLYLQYHFESVPRSRRIAMEMLRQPGSRQQ